MTPISTGTPIGTGTSWRLWLRPALLGLHAFAVAAIVFCVFMGLWQMGVYDSRRAEERADKQHVPTVALKNLWGPDEAFTSRLNHRPVTMSGRFAPSADQVWVSGKVQHGKKGYWLLAPFIVKGGDQALLVVRAWSLSAGDLPAVPETTSLRAVLEPGEGSGAPLEANRVIGSVRIPALINSLPYDLYSGFAISTSPQTAEGLTLATQPQPDASWTSGLRNLMYALQWWVFAAFTLLMWWRMSTESVALSRRKVA
ncbi:MAG: SURF1 family protein [Aeromicrobium sp.]